MKDGMRYSHVFSGTGNVLHLLFSPFRVIFLCGIFIINILFFVYSSLDRLTVHSDDARGAHEIRFEPPLHSHSLTLLVVPTRPSTLGGKCALPNTCAHDIQPKSLANSIFIFWVCFSRAYCLLKKLG